MFGSGDLLPDKLEGETKGGGFTTSCCTNAFQVHIQRLLIREERFREQHIHWRTFEEQSVYKMYERVF